MCHGQVTVSMFSGGRETRESRSSTELQSHSLQQVEQGFVSGNKASRGASEILKATKDHAGKGRGKVERLNSKGKSTEYLKVHRRTSLRLALSYRESLYTSIRSHETSHRKVSSLMVKSHHESSRVIKSHCAAWRSPQSFRSHPQSYDSFRVTTSRHDSVSYRSRVGGHVATVRVTSRQSRVTGIVRRQSG
jgi:hypothetical protein